MIEFELDEEIEVSNSSDFRKALNIRGKFKHRNPFGGKYYIVGADGYMHCADYARKIIDEKVRVQIWNKGFWRMYETSKELADKIKRGEV
jgi:hypothetical protein